MDTQQNEFPSDEQREARLTAWALNQLDDAERAALEADLQSAGLAEPDSAELGKLAAALRSFSQEEPEMKPSTDLREAIERRLDELQPISKPPIRKSPRVRVVAFASLAASLLVAAAGVWYVIDKDSGDQDLFVLGVYDRIPEQVALRDGRDSDISGNENDEESLLRSETSKRPLGSVVANEGRQDLEGLVQRIKSRINPGGVKNYPSGVSSDSMQSLGNRVSAQRPAEATTFTPGYRAPSDGSSGTLNPSVSLYNGQTRSQARSRRGSVDEQNFDAELQQPSSRIVSGRGQKFGGGGGGGGPGGGMTTTSIKADRSLRMMVRTRILGVGEDSDDGVVGHVTAGEPPSRHLSEQYDQIIENPFLTAGKAPLSTFSIDVDTASYANVRRFLTGGSLPPKNAVRIEELVNYFDYQYPPPRGEVPFSVKLDAAPCPWNAAHRLVCIGLKGKEIDRGERGPGNLVFLLDVSGSMSDQNKLPLVKRAMRMLVDQLSEDDRVAIVTYAGEAGIKLQSTHGQDKKTILAVIDQLQSGGSTNGSAGIRLAYQQALDHFIQGGTNRVILATDGDLNVGITSDDELVEFIGKQAESGVFLTVLGFGTGNLKDSKLEKLADRGNGSYAYIDNLREAHKVLVEQLTGSLITIAKDVKLQIEFNPAQVQAYRLIGYENRVLAARDFADDKKDAGEIGAGHTVTALYEIVPVGQTGAVGKDGRTLKYQQAPRKQLTDAAQNGELLSLRLRYKQPDGQRSKLLEFALKDTGKGFGEASADFRFAAAVASFGMLLRDSEHKGNATLAAVEEIAGAALGDDPKGYRSEFVDLVRRARELSTR